MIKVNTDELDRLSELFLQLGADTDNTLGITTMLRNEMLEDVEFIAHPKSESIIAIMDGAINSLIGLNEDIRSVENLFRRAKNDFSDNDKDLVKSIEEITNKLDSIKNQLDVTIASNQVVVIDRSEELRPVNEVEKLVTGNSTDLEMANIAALSQLARQETEVKKIEDKQ